MGGRKTTVRQGGRPERCPALLLAPSRSTLHPHALPPSCTAAEERRVAICVMDDVLEHSPAGSAKYAPQVLPLLLSGCADRDTNVRQCCVYGLGCAAQHR